MTRSILRVAIAIVAVGILVVVVLNIFGILQLIPSSKHKTSIQSGLRLYPRQHGQHGASLPQVGLQQGELAPDFTLVTIDGHSVSLNKYRGQPILVNFWMINCDGCRMEIPLIQHIYAREQQEHKDLVILGVNIIDGPISTQQFVSQYGLTYPIARDTQATVGALYTLRGTPTSFFLDRQGIIRAKVEGTLDETSLQQAIQTILT